MKTTRTNLLILLVLLVGGPWVLIVYQRLELNTRRFPEERLVELLEQAQLNEHHLMIVAAQNAVLTTRTLAILERVAPAPLYTPYHGPDEPLVIYEGVPVKAPAKKNSRK